MLIKYSVIHPVSSNPAFLFQVEKSLQRIRNGQRNPMYTTQHSIEKKVGPVTGWRDLLTAVGFRLEPAYNGLPPAVFFPTSDPADRLMQCSASLQALFGKQRVNLCTRVPFDVYCALYIGFEFIIFFDLCLVYMLQCVQQLFLMLTVFEYLLQ